MVMFYKGDINSPVCIGGANGLLSGKVVNTADGSSPNAPNGASPPSSSEATSSTPLPGSVSIPNAPVAQPAQPNTTPTPRPNPLLPSIDE